MYHPRNKKSRTRTFRHLIVEPLEDRQLLSAFGIALQPPLAHAALAAVTALRTLLEIGNAPPPLHVATNDLSADFSTVVSARGTGIPIELDVTSARRFDNEDSAHNDAFGLALGVPVRASKDRGLDIALHADVTLPDTATPPPTGDGMGRGSSDGLGLEITLNTGAPLPDAKPSSTGEGIVSNGPDLDIALNTNGTSPESALTTTVEPIGVDLGLSAELGLDRNAEQALPETTKAPVIGEDLDLTLSNAPGLDVGLNTGATLSNSGETSPSGTAISLDLNPSNGPGINVVLNTSASLNGTGRTPPAVQIVGVTLGAQVNVGSNIGLIGSDVSAFAGAQPSANNLSASAVVSPSFAGANVGRSASQIIEPSAVAPERTMIVEATAAAGQAPRLDSGASATPADDDNEAFPPDTSSLLSDAPPFDLAAMDRALQQFLEPLDDLRDNVGALVGNVGLVPWAFMSLAVAAALFEIARRRRTDLVTSDLLTSNAWTQAREKS